MDQRPPRAIVADDHAEIRRLVTRILAEECDVVASVADGRELVDAAASVDADVLIVDVAMPVMNGLDALRTLRRLGIMTPAVVLTSSDDPALADESLRVGASGFVVKDRIATDFRPAVRAALRGERFVSTGTDRDR